MYKRIKNTTADMEADSYEKSGKTPQEAWDLVLANFHEKTKNLSPEDRELRRIAHFEAIGPTF